MTKSLLLVEDNKLTRQRLRGFLEGLGLDILEAASGQEALDLARERLPSIIVTDIMLPGLSGLDLARALKGDPATKAIPIVAVTTLAIAADIDAIKAAGCDALVAKPILQEALVNTVKGMLSAAA